MKKHYIIILVCLLFVFAGLLRINDLTLYTPDSIRYLIWSNSIVQGKGLIDYTQPESDKYVVHAPLLSMILTPITIFTSSILAAKLWIIIFGLLSVLFLYLWLSRLLNDNRVFIGILIFVFNPLLLIYSTEILSEVPFIALMLLIMFLCEVISTKERKIKLHYYILLLILLLIPLLREVGFALIGSVFLFFLFRKNWSRAIFVLIIPLIFYSLWFLRNELFIGESPESQVSNTSLVLQHFVTSADASLVNEIILRVWLNFKAYFLQLGGMLLFPLFSTPQHKLMLEVSNFYLFIKSTFEFVQYLIVILGISSLYLGIKHDLRESVTAKLRISFLVLYLIVIFIYPIHDIRFLFPLLPILIYYFVLGASNLLKKYIFQFNSSKTYLAVIAIVILLVPNATGICEILKANTAYIKSSVTLQQRLQSASNYSLYFSYPWSYIGDWIQKNVEPNAVIATPSKELSVVVGDRKVLELNPGLPANQFELVLRDNDVGYLLAPMRWSNVKAYELQMQESEFFRFEQVYSTANLFLFKIHNRLTENNLAFSTIQHSDDSLTVKGLLIKGRRLLLGEDYLTSIQIFENLLNQSSEHPELIYQLAVSYEMVGNIEKAIKLYQRLISLPQAGTYILLSRNHLEVITLLSQCQAAKSYEERSVKTLQASKSYWDLGYLKRANNLLNKILENDSTYFTGLLWGTYYNMRLSDTIHERNYLARLEQIDITNLVVQAFRKIRLNRDSINSVKSQERVSRLYLSNAKLFFQIELYEDAIDEIYRALSHNPNDVEVIGFLAKIFEQKGRIKRAKDLYKKIVFLDSKNSQAISKLDSLSVMK